MLGLVLGCVCLHHHLEKIGFAIILLAAFWDALGAVTLIPNAAARDSIAVATLVGCHAAVVGSILVTDWQEGRTGIRVILAALGAAVILVATRVWRPGTNA